MIVKLILICIAKWIRVRHGSSISRGDSYLFTFFVCNLLLKCNHMGPYPYNCSLFKLLIIFLYVYLLKCHWVMLHLYPTWNFKKFQFLAICQSCTRKILVKYSILACYISFVGSIGEFLVALSEVFTLKEVSVE